MAKLNIKKMQIIFLQKDTRDILSELQRIGVTELSEVDDERLNKISAGSRAAAYERNLRSAEESLEILAGYSPPKGGVAAMFSGRTELLPEEYERRGEDAENSLKIVLEVLSLAGKINECRGEIQKCEISVAQLSLWERLDIPMTERKTEKCMVFTGTLPFETNEQELYSTIFEKAPDSAFELTVIGSGSGQTAITAIVYDGDADNVYGAMRELGFTRPSDPTKHAPSVRLEKIEKRTAELREVIAESQKEIMALSRHRDEIKFLADYLTVKAEEYRELEKLGVGESVMVLEGYIPEKYIPDAEEIFERFTVSAEFFDPPDDEDVPVLFENNSFAEPMESVVEMYSMPSRRDIDPSSVMAFFYYLLFGMMLSDAGYGILMTLFCAVVLAKTSVEGNMRKMMKMFFWSGISTTVWGALFGSFFGDIIPVIYTEFLELPAPDIALWFVPIENSLKLLVFSLGVGICHLLLGLVANIYMSKRDGFLVRGLLENIPVMLLVLGVAPFGGSVFVDVPAVAVNIGLYIAALGAVGIILFSGGGSKSFVARIGSGLYALYNNVSGYLSDILSYSRLLALGLATGSIAEVINMMGTLPDNKIAKAILLAVVFVLGHSLNMAINLLGAYVHTVRLQFVELLPKFYEGGGRGMKPFAMNTKYFKLTKKGKGKSVGKKKPADG